MPTEDSLFHAWHKKVSKSLIANAEEWHRGEQLHEYLEAGRHETDGADSQPDYTSLL